MILVTGGTGFVGSHLLLHLLGQQQTIRATYRDIYKIQKTKSLFAFYGKEDLFEKISWVLADITDIPSLEPAFENVNFVYHCAALVSFDPSDEELLRKINIEGTANVANLSLAYGIEKLCHVSSIAALGDLHESETVINEQTEWNPEKYHSDYAISKYGAEMEIWRAQQEGLKVVIVNPGVIIGPGFEDGSGEIFIKIRDGLRYYTKGKTGFVSVESVVKAMILLMESAISGERFCLVSDNIRFDDLATKIALELQVKAPAKYAPKWLTEIAWRLDSVVSFLFRTTRKLSRSTAKSLHTTELYSGNAIEKAIDFKYFAIDDALKITSEYFRNGNLIS